MYIDYRVLQKQLTADVVTIIPCNKCYVYQFILFNYYHFGVVGYIVYYIKNTLIKTKVSAQLVS